MRGHRRQRSNLRLVRGSGRGGQSPGLGSRLADGGRLWAAWLRAPRQVGALVPSSMRLAAAMARQVPPGDGLVIELGGGTGSITAGLLAAGIGARQLVVVERDPLLAQRLRQRFPDCRVLCGDGCRLPQLLGSHRIQGRVKAVVSSLPLLSMPVVRRVRLMRSVERLLQGQGAMIQYTYGVRCPVPDRTLSRGGVRATRTGRIWRNLPPASIWLFEPALLAPPIPTAVLGAVSES